MFRWYRSAAKCYVYLDDVSVDSLADSDEIFLKSKWFTRGWTLQELLAPRNVEFFSKEGDLIGSKSSRVEEIAKTTHIPTEALRERALSQFSVEQRLVWAKERETTREEDLAYSLMGIFDIHMPLIYGEGKDKAFKRLYKEIKTSLEDGANMPLSDAQSWLQSETVNKDVQEFLRQRLSNDKGVNKWEDGITLRSDHFEFVSEIPTELHETNKYYKLLMVNSIREGKPDLIVVKRTGRGDCNIEVHVLSAASNYQNFSLQVSTPLRESLAVGLDFSLTDWNGNGILDLVMIKQTGTGTNSTEVHILSGAYNFQVFMLQTVTILPETDDTFAFAIARLDADSKPDLFAIKRAKNSSKSTEVHILSGATNFQSYVLRTNIGLPETDATFEFAVTDWNADGHPDLVAIKKSTTSGRCTEVHVLSGASMYKNFILRSKTPVYRSNGLFEFAVADWTGNGKPDLIAFKKTATETNTTELHVMAEQD